MGNKKDTVKERLSAVETGLTGIHYRLDRMDKRLEGALPGKVLIVIINVLLLGIFVWCGILTYCIAGR